MSALILKNGRVICPATGRDEVGDLGVVNGRLVAAEQLPDDARILDATGLVVAPGFVDLHCDLAAPGHAHREGLETGTAAAVRGGFTTLCVTPATNPVLDQAGLIADVRRSADALQRARVRPVGAATLGLAGQRLTEMFALRGAGAVAVGDGGRPIAETGLLRRIMEYAKAAHLPMWVWPATPGLDGVMHEGAVATRLGLSGTPAASEEIAVARAIALAELTQARVHIGPVTTAAAVRLIADAKARAVPVTASTTAAHISLTDADIAQAYDANLHVRPPLRPQGDVDAVRQGLADGTIDALGSGHEPRSVAEKATPFASSAPGMMGLETALGLVLKRVAAGDLSLARAMAILSVGPARAFALSADGLALGAVADLVLFDPAATQRICSQGVARCASRARNTPFMGQALPGKVRWTLVAGRVAYDAAVYDAAAQPE